MNVLIVLWMNVVVGKQLTFDTNRVKN